MCKGILLSCERDSSLSRHSPILHSFGSLSLFFFFKYSVLDEQNIRSGDLIACLKQSVTGQGTQIMRQIELKECNYNLPVVLTKKLCIEQHWFLGGWVYALMRLVCSFLIKTCTLGCFFALFNHSWGTIALLVVLLWTLCCIANVWSKNVFLDFIFPPVVVKTAKCSVQPKFKFCMRSKWIILRWLITFWQ